jgi:hypothetical protein
MKSLKSVEYTFKFDIGDNYGPNVAGKMFAILSDPEKTKSIIGETLGYKTFFEAISHQEDDYVSYQHETFEFFANESLDENDNSYTVGLPYHEELSLDVVKSLYLDVIAPVFAHLSEQIKPTGVYSIKKEYTETVEDVFFIRKRLAN